MARRCDLRCLILVLAILWLVPIVGAPALAAGLDVPALIAAAPPTSAYADADAVVLWREIDLAFAPDGRLTRRDHVVTRLQTQWAMRNLSDVRVDWDRTRQDLVIHTCRTFMADGTAVPSPDNAFNEVTPDAVAAAAPFLDLREMVISHVGTEEGCVLDLDYEVRDRAPGACPAGAVVALQGRWPVCKVTARVTPADVAASFLHGEGLSLATSDDGGSRVWHLRDLPAVPTTGDEAPRGDVLARIVVARTHDWRDAAGALRTAVEAATADLGDDLRDWLAEGEDLTREDTVRRIVTLVHEGVHRIALPTGTWSRAPRPVADVYASAVATPIEQACLALALLRAAGLQPELGLFTRAREPAKDVAALSQLVTPRLVFPLDGDNWWLAPEKDAPWSGPCDLAGRTGLFLEAGGGIRTWTVPAGSAHGRLAGTITVGDDGGVTAEIDLTLTGGLREGLGTADEIAHAWAAGFGVEPEVTDLDVRRDTPREVHLRLHARAARLAVPTGGVTIYLLPLSPAGVLDRLPAGFHAEQPARTTALFADETYAEEVALTLRLPENLMVDAAPRSASATCPRGKYDLVSERSAHGLTVRRSLSLDAGRWEPDDYPALRAMLTLALHQNAAPIVVVPAP